MEIVTIFELKVVFTRARKFANFVRLYLPHITTFFNQLLEFYYFYVKGSFWEFRFYCLDQKLVYNANCPLPDIILELILYCRFTTRAKLTAAVAIQVPQSRNVSTVMLSNAFLITGITKSHKLTSYNKNNIWVNRLNFIYTG